MAYPIGITKIPSPNEADIAKLAVLEGLNPKLYSIATEKKRAYMAERKSPELITPAYDTRVSIPIHWKAKTMIVEATRPLNNKRSLFATGPYQ